MKHPDVQDVCVVGIPAEGAGEIPRAFIQLREGVARTNDKAEEIRAFLDGMVTNYKRLRGGVEFRDISELFIRCLLGSQVVLTANCLQFPGELPARFFVVS